MAKHNDVTGWYGGFFKTWLPGKLGPKPTAEQLDTIHKLGARPGKQALANAMALRDCGVTGSQIVIACGAPQLNKMRGFIADGWLKREAVPASAEGHTVYKLTLTAKGEKRIKAAETRAAEQLAETVKAGKAKHKAAPGDRAARKARQAAAKAALAAKAAPAEPAPVQAPAEAPAEQVQA